MKKIFKPINKLFAFRNIKKFSEGGIELISPGFISGWVLKKNCKFDIVQFWANSILISEASINEYRPDVNEKFNIRGNYGFKLEIPKIVLNHRKRINPKVIAVDSKNKIKINLTCFLKPKKTKEFLVNLISSDVIGLQGYFDGINTDQKLQGWAGYKNSNEIASIWIHSKDNSPIEIICDEFRPNLITHKVKENSGFLVDIEDLPRSILGQEIWVCFDKKGIFKLPQKEKFLKLPTIDIKNITEEISISEKNSIVEKIGYSNKIVSAPSELKQYWEELEDYRKYLDKVEYQIDNFLEYKEEKILKKSKYPKLLRWIKGNF